MLWSDKYILIDQPFIDIHILVEVANMLASISLAISFFSLQHVFKDYIVESTATPSRANELNYILWSTKFTKLMLLAYASRI